MSADPFDEWWEDASDEERAAFLNDSTDADATPVRPPTIDVIRDLADYQPRGTP